MIQNDESDIVDEMMLPGFRFHPTDEELVSFYLKRKIQQKPLTIELIKQLDIYKYDPWDLPKLATTGEKEWYFYCPRDRKYRNSARPNRVTRAGFWKATGTDRPVYSSDGSRCIGLKKSLVFYEGRAAKGMKTDWMMHEFRLPTLTNSTAYKRPIEKNLPANDSWAICRIFKKTSSNAQRALSRSCIPSSTEITTPDNFTTTIPEPNQIKFSNNSSNKSDIYDFPLIDIPFYKPSDPVVAVSPFLSIVSRDLPFDFNMFVENSNKSENLNFAGMQQQYTDTSLASLEQEMCGNTRTIEEDTWIDSLHIPQVQNQLENLGSVEFPITLCGDWRPDSSWDFLSCPTDFPIEFSNNCFT